MRTEYMRLYMRERRSNAKTHAEREAKRRKYEAEAVGLSAMRAQVGYWPLRQGYNAAERGQPYDEMQSDDWRIGWRLWHRRHGRAA